MKNWQRYPEYKDSGVEWLGEIPKHWEVKKIKYICQILRGKFTHRPRNDPRFYNGYYPFIQTGDVAAANKYVTTYKQTLNDLGFAVSKEFPKGTLIMTIAANIGDIAILDFAACFPDSIVGFVPQNKNNLNYLYYNFLAIRPELIKTATLNTQMNLNMEQIASLFSVLPPLLEQKAIAHFLDRETSKLDNLIAKKERFIELLQEKRTALISHTVTKGLNPDVPMKDSGISWLGQIPQHWEVKKLKYLINIQGGYAFSSNDFVEAGIQLIKIANLYQNQLHLDRQPTFLPDDYIKLYSPFIVKKGDILMSLTGTLGKRDYGFAVLLKTNDKFLLNQRVAKISLKDSNKIVKDFILYLLQTELYLYQLFLQPSGTKQGNLSENHVTSPYIVHPPLSEQKAIAQFLDQETAKIDTLIEKTKTSIEKLKEYRTALISAAVTGKIDIRQEII